MIRKNIISSVIAIVILILSLTGQDTFSRMSLPKIQNLDKIVHAVMYFTLMAAIIWENRNIAFNLRNCLILGSIPFVFGAVIEMLQRLFTTSRSGDIFDILFNLGGIVLAFLIWVLFKRFFSPGSK